jgi:Ca2+-binding EF-hand superfamily protein
MPTGCELMSISFNKKIPKKTKIHFMKYIPLFLAISLGTAHGKSNSSGHDSPVLYGEIIAVSDDRKTVTILQSGTDKREIMITKKTKLSFVGMGKKSQELTVGYWGKAKVKNGEAGSLKLTQPVGKLKLLGPERISMDEKSIFTAVDVNRDSGIDFVEMSRMIYHSPKHGPDKFEKYDADANGLLDEEEFPVLLDQLAWWRFSRKSADNWFMQADANADGKLDEKEFGQTFDTGNHTENRFKRADGDKSGFLDKPEVSEFYQSLISGGGENEEDDSKRKKKKRKK